MKKRFVICVAAMIAIFGASPVYAIAVENLPEIMQNIHCGIQSIMC